MPGRLIGWWRAKIAWTGRAVQTTILATVSSDMRLYQEEIFGPVVEVMPFDDDEQVFAEAKNSLYGLAARAWTRVVRRSPNVWKSG